MKRFQNLKISAKLYTAFIFVIILALIVGVLGILNIVTMDREDAELFDNTMMLKYSGASEGQFRELCFGVLELTTFTDQPEEFKETMSEVSGAYDQVKQNFDSLKALASKSEADTDDIKTADESGAITDIIAKMDEELTAYKSELDKALAFYEAGDYENGNDIALNNLDEASDALRDDYTALSSVVMDQASAQQMSNKTQSRMEIIKTACIFAVAIVIILLIARYIAHNIARPMAKMSAAAKKLSFGDLNADIGQLLSRKDEVGELADAFSVLIDTTKQQAQTTQLIADGDLTADVIIRSKEDILGIKLSELVEKLRNVILTMVSAADQVASGAGVVSDSSMALSMGAAEQTGEINQLSLSLNMMLEQTNKTSQNADEANKLASNTKANATDGNEQMKEMLDAMKDISDSSSTIGRIIKVIDDIAFQTNILALNAAVEAARAGQHGKGFAVVAEEVRNLAAKSAAAAKETSEMIENSIAKVQKGTRIANKTAEALDKIVAEIDKVADLIGSIAIASQEQAAGIDEIDQAIARVSKVVQTNAATSQESAAASEELSAQAAYLKELVDMFKVHNTGKSLNSGATGNKERHMLPAARQGIH